MNKITGFSFFTKCIFYCALFLGCNNAFATNIDNINLLRLINTSYVLFCSALVMVMTPGLALFYAGMVRNQNLVATMMHSFIKLCVVSIAWFFIGYTLTYSDTSIINGLIGDFKFFCLNDVCGYSPLTVYNLNEFAFIAFQGMFAVITSAIITGSFAERVKLIPVIIFSLLWTIFVYTPIAHWIWGNGWLHKIYNTLDFSGGMVVHINAATAGLVAAITIGKRSNFKPETNTPRNNKKTHLTIFGAGLLWFGWFGFNAGSALEPNDVAGIAFVNTIIAPAASGLSWMLLEYALRKKLDVLGIIYGTVAGLVAITPAAGYIEVKYALVTGIFAGIICYWGVSWLKPKLGYDDALDVFGIHGIGGFWGVIATGIFCSKSVNEHGLNGLIHGHVEVVLNQIVAALIVAIYSAVATFIIISIMKTFIKIRATEEEERLGLDMIEQ